MIDFQFDIEQCLEVLKNGGIILYPTDTVWGIGCDATDTKAIEKIYQLKKRTDEKAMIVLLADERDVLQYTSAPDLKVFEYLQQTEKPTTVIYEGALGFAANLLDYNGSIAIRICNEVFCKQLIKRFRKPIVSTSANISGEPYPKNFSEISEEIKNGVDYIVQYRQKDTTIGEPSAIIKWNNNRAPTIIRP
jgi:L-threonylcarbamoyladenylate synthase